MAAGWKDDWYPQRPVGNGGGAWFGMLAIAWSFLFFPPAAIYGWSDIDWIVGLGVCAAFSLGVTVNQWEDRRAARKREKPGQP